MLFQMLGLGSLQGEASRSHEWRQKLVRLVAGSAREKDRPATSSVDGGRSQLDTADSADPKGPEAGAGAPPLSAPHAPQPACSRPKVRL